MPATEIKDLVEEIINEDQPKEQKPSTDQEPSTDLSPEIKNSLAASRSKMKSAAKNFILGGITDALNEIAVGDFSDCAEELVIEIESFTEEVTVPKLQTKVSSPSTLFALPGTTHNG